jgi:mannose-6-phosphate isomerase-like protein (cupin superfamily)
METIHDPIHRASYAFRREGDNLWVMTWLDDGGHLPEHFHPSLEEHWEVLEGSVRVKLAGEWRDLTTDDGPVLVARGVRHELRNSSGARAHLQCQVLPAGDLEAFLTESARAAREGLYNRHSLPTSLRGAGWIAQFALRFRHETVMCSPPPAVQRVVLPLLARIAPTPRTA